jgi:hypothetical protein
MASLEKRSISNLIEVMADERWDRLAEQQGIAYAKTVAEAINLKLDMNDPADREKLRRAILDVVAEKKAKANRAWLKFCRSLFGKHFTVRFSVREILPVFCSDGNQIDAAFVFARSHFINVHHFGSVSVRDCDGFFNMDHWETSSGFS